MSFHDGRAIVTIASFSKKKKKLSQLRVLIAMFMGRQGSLLSIPSAFLS